MLNDATSFRERGLFVVMIVAIAAIIIDSEIGYVSDFIPDFVSSPFGLGIFVATAITFGLTQYFILKYLRDGMRQLKARSLHLDIMQKAVTVAQFVLVGLTGALIIQIVLSSQYNTLSIYMDLAISYGMWIVMTAFLARAFVSWYRSQTMHAQSKGSMLVLIFALSMIAYVVNGVFGLTDYVTMLLPRSPTVLSTDVANFPDYDPESIASQANNLSQISSIVAYLLTWIGTVLLLRPNIARFGRARFWAIMCFALVYYAINYPLFVLGYLSPSGESDQEVMNFILLTSMSSLVAGIILGIAFLSMARTLEKTSPARRYLTIAAYGMLVFYVAGSAMVTQAAYPPFGFVSTAFTGMSTFMLYMGLYSSAVAVSQDSILRKAIMKSAKEQSKLLDSISTAQFEKGIQTIVTDASKKAAEMEEASGVEPSMSNDDIKDYLEFVMKEVKGRQNQ